MNTPIQQIGASLESSLAKENLVDIIAGLSDYTFEKLLEAGEGIPIFSYLTKGLKASLAVRDAVFMEKVISFLRSVGDIPIADRMRMVQRIQDDEKFRVKFGKFSIIALDRYDDELKAHYLGVAAGYLARQEIDYEFYQRFSHIVDKLAVCDLEELTEKTLLNFGRDTFNIYEANGLITIVHKLPTEQDRKTAWKRDPNEMIVRRRYLTHWGETVKKILLGQPITSENSHVEIL